MPRYYNVNSTGSCIPNMLKQFHPQTGGLRWLGVLYVMSETQARFGSATSNCRSSTFAATGSVCLLSVVETNLRFHLARNPVSRISVRTR